MEYKCTDCNYATYDKSNFQKHLKSIKHNKKVLVQTNKTQMKPKTHSNETVKYICQFCSNTFSTASSLARHRRACVNKDTIEMDYTQHINELSKKLEIEKELRFKDLEMNKKLEDEVKYLKSLIHNAGAVIKTSVSALSYVAQNYDKAPALGRLKDYSYIKEQEIDEDNSDIDEFDLIDNLIYHHNRETIQEYLGNVIVEAYKKKDPKKQSIWNSDTVRLTYIIRELINKKPDWSVDKKGIKTTKYIIEPLLEYIREEVANYVIENTADKYIHLSEFVLGKHAEKLNHCGQIMASIDNKTLSKSVLRYIAPHFYLAKPEQLLEEK